MSHHHAHHREHLHQATPAPAPLAAGEVADNDPKAPSLISSSATSLTDINVLTGVSANPQQQLVGSQPEAKRSTSHHHANANTAPPPPTSHSPQQQEYTPPSNFSAISEGLFRSSYPTKKNFAFLRDVVKLKSICYLCPEDYPEVNNVFNAANGIRLLRFPMDGNKEPLQEIPAEKMHAALTAIVDVRNHPLLIHCNAGKHRTGCVSGCVRRLQGWSLVSIFSEYVHFTGDKPRLADQLFIELYTPQIRLPRKFAAPWLAAIQQDMPPPPPKEVLQVKEYQDLEVGGAAIQNCSSSSKDADRNVGRLGTAAEDGGSTEAAT